MSPRYVGTYGKTYCPVCHGPCQDTWRRTIADIGCAALWALLPLLLALVAWWVL